MKYDMDTNSYSPRQRQRIREQFHRHQHERCQWWETFVDWDSGDVVRIPVSAREAATAAVYGYATITLEDDGERA